MSRLLKTRSLRGLGCLAAAALAFVPALASAQGFTSPLSGGSVVVQLMTGTSGSATAINFREYTTGGTLLQTGTLPSTGANAQTDSASASSNGYFNIFGTNMAVPGVNLAIPAANANTSNNKATTFLSTTTGSITSQALTGTGGPSGTPPTPFSGNNYRSVISTTGSTAWLAGTSNGSPVTGGVWYYDGTGINGYTRLTASSSLSNLRNIEVYGSGTAQQLFVSTGSGTGSPTVKGIYTVGTGLPTSGTANALTSLIVTGTGSESPYGFVLFSTGSSGSALDLAYIADDRTVGGGGISKWTLSSGTWSLNGSFRFDTTTNFLSTGTSGANLTAIRGLAGTYVSGTTTLFATTSQGTNNALISFVDNGSGFSTSTPFTTLGTAGAGQAFRGVDLVPVPEPSTLVLAGIGVGAAGWTALRRRSPHRPSA